MQHMVSCKGWILGAVTVAVLLQGAKPALAAPQRAKGVNQPGQGKSPDRSRPAKAQDAASAKPGLTMSLADAVFLGMRDNPAIRSAYVDRVAQRYDLFVAEDQFTPHAVIQGAATRQETAGIVTETAVLSPGVAAVTPYGTTFTFSWDNTATGVSGGRSLVSTGTIAVTQPLLKGAGLDVNLAPLRTARLSEDINQLRLRQTVEQTITSIISAYRELIRAQEAQKLAEDAVTRAQALVDVDQTLIAAGRLARTEVVQAQSFVEQQRLTVLQSRSRVEQARLALAVLLDLDLGTKVDVQEALHPTRPAVTLDQAMEVALLRRPDYLIQHDIVEQSKLGLVVADNERLWDLSLVGTSRVGQERDTIPGLRPTRTLIADTLVGARLTIPLNDPAIDQPAVHAVGAIRDADIQLKSIKRGIEQQIRAGLNDLDIRWQQLGIAHNAETLAGSAVDIEKQKLSVGRSTTFQVQSLEETYRNTQNQRLNAEIDYANALSLFDLQLGTTLDTWKIAVRDR